MTKCVTLYRGKLGYTGYTPSERNACRKMWEVPISSKCRCFQLFARFWDSSLFIRALSRLRSILRASAKILDTEELFVSARKMAATRLAKEVLSRRKNMQFIRVRKLEIVSIWRQQGLVRVWIWNHLKLVHSWSWIQALHFKRYLVLEAHSQVCEP